jgi:hypothetical protein
MSIVRVFILAVDASGEGPYSHILNLTLEPWSIA